MFSHNSCRLKCSRGNNLVKLSCNVIHLTRAAIHGDIGLHSSPKKSTLKLERSWSCQHLCSIEFWKRNLKNWPPIMQVLGVHLHINTFPWKKFVVESWGNWEQNIWFLGRHKLLSPRASFTTVFFQCRSSFNFWNHHRRWKQIQGCHYTWKSLIDYLHLSYCEFGYGSLHSVMNHWESGT